MSERAAAAGGASRCSPRALIWATLAGAAALSILAQGFRLPGPTNSWHFPILFDWVGSAEGPDDAFTGSLRRFASQVWPLLSLVTDETNWQGVLWLVHYLTRLATLAALFLLFDRLPVGAVPARRVRALAVACLFGIGLASFRQSPLGGGEVMMEEFSHSSLNVPLALFLFLAAAERRWWWAALLLGLLFNVNAFVALWLGLATALAFWTVEREYAPAYRIRRGLGPAALAVLLALPTAVALLEAVGAAEPPPGFDFRAFLADFYGGHFFVEDVPAGGLVAFLLMLAALTFFRLQLMSRIPREALAALSGIAGVLVLVALFGALLPHLSGSALLLNLHPMRMDFLLVWLFYLGLGLLLVLRDPLDLPAAMILVALFAGLFLPLLLLLPLLAPRDGRGAGPVALVCFLAAAIVAIFGDLPALVFSTHRWVQAIQLGLLLGLMLYGAATKRLEPATTIFGALLAFLGSALAARLLGWGPWPAVGVLTLAGLWHVRQSPRLGRAPLSPTRHLPAIALFLAATAALLPGVRHLAETGRLDRYDPRSLSFLSAQRWAREATPPGSLFLAPDWQLRANLTPSFWTLSRRPVWVDWRQGAAVHWQPDFFPQWQTRMTEVAALDDVAQKLDYARAQGIDYVILEADEPRPDNAVSPVYDDGLTVILPAVLPVRGDDQP